MDHPEAEPQFCAARSRPYVFSDNPAGPNTDTKREPRMPGAFGMKARTSAKEWNMKASRPTVLGLALLIALTVLWTGLAAAQSTQPQSDQRPMMRCSERFDQLDTNHDGMVSKDEFMAVPHRRGNAEKNFANRDGNKDGTLTREEFCSGAGPGARGRGPMPQ